MADHVDWYVFNDNGQMPGAFLHQQRYSQITIGEVNAQDMGGGQLLIQKATLNGSSHTIRVITAEEFEVMQDRTLRVELHPGCEIYVSLQNATDPNLYIEHRQQRGDQV